MKVENFYKSILICVGYYVIIYPNVYYDDLAQNNETENIMSTELREKTPIITEEISENKKAKKRRRRLGDRADGRKLRSIAPMHRLMPYLMAKRSDAQNTFADSFNITKTDRFCREQVKAGNKDFGFLHVLLAAYVRTISQRPGINRFISGQKVYARNEIEINMAVKRELSIEGEETMISVLFEPTDTIDDVYRKFSAAVSEAVNAEESGFDKLARVINYIPGLLLRGAVGLLFFLDYFGLLPRFITRLSPFHGSMIVTSMGSLGIKPIYHHIYDFGNLPVFLAYGKKETVHVFLEDGTVAKQRRVEFKVVTDERICDGFYFASAFKIFKRYVENPELLVEPPEEVFEDID